MNAHLPRYLSSFALLVIFSLTGCNNTTQPPVARDNGTEAHPRNSGNQPRDSSAGYARANESRRRQRHGRPQEQAAPGQFDFYLLNLSWSPEFCATHPGSPGCVRRLGFVVHGLWPQDANGDYPQHCGDAPGPANPRADMDIMPTTSLVEHEWQTHGTCSGLGSDDYFRQMHQAYAAVKLPENIGVSSDAGGVAPEDLLARFAAANPTYPAASFALSCGNNRLTAVEICLTKELRPLPCQGVRSCRASVVQVTPR
jgi:ribonuclease T2